MQSIREVAQLGERRTLTFQWSKYLLTKDHLFTLNSITHDDLARSSQKSSKKIRRRTGNCIRHSSVADGCCQKSNRGRHCKVQAELVGDRVGVKLSRCPGSDDQAPLRVLLLRTSLAVEYRSSTCQYLGGRHTRSRRTCLQPLRSAFAFNETNGLVSMNPATSSGHVSMTTAGHSSVHVQQGLDSIHTQSAIEATLECKASETS